MDFERDQNPDVESNSVETNELHVKSDSDETNVLFVESDTKEAKITEYVTEFERDQKSGCGILYERP